MAAILMMAPIVALNLPKRSSQPVETEAGALSAEVISDTAILAPSTSEYVLSASTTASNFRPGGATAEIESWTSTSVASTTTTGSPSTVEPESEWKDAGNGVRLPDVLLRIRFCESTNNYGASHSYSSARGAYQFLTGSWGWYGHAERYGVSTADRATAAQQDEAALLTWQADGTRPWLASRPCWSDPGIDPDYANHEIIRPNLNTTTTAPRTTTTKAETTTTKAETTTTKATEPTSTTEPETTTTEKVTTTTKAETTTTKAKETTTTKAETTTTEAKETTSTTEAETTTTAKSETTTEKQ